MVTAADIARSIGELGPQLIGDGERRVAAAVRLDAAFAGALVFARQAGPAFDTVLAGFTDVTVICPTGTTSPSFDASRVTMILVDNPRLAFARAVNRTFVSARPKPGIHPTAVVDSTSRIDPSATIGPLVAIGPDCSVGANTILHAGVVLYDNVRIGENVIVHSGTVIGADGFGYERAEDGTFDKFPHVGGVVVEADVEIGSNTSIDRGALADTMIKRGAKIDNQVHISHNVVVGAHSVVIAQSMIGGSVVIGDGCWIAPAACVMNQRRIGERATVGLQALVVKDVAARETVMGAPATSQSEYRAQRAALKRLTEE